MTKNIRCSFCNKDKLHVDAIIKGPGNNLFICNNCLDHGLEVLHSGHGKKKPKKPPMLTPEEIKSYLDLHIIGQDQAKITMSVALYNHYKRINTKDDNVELDKSNVLMVGPSGSGKTLMMKTAATLLDIPYVIIDSTSITESGYTGDDVYTILEKLLDAADGDLDLAEQGIVFIDEIDKKRKKTDSYESRDVSGEGVQQALLKIIEGSVVRLPETHDRDSIDFDTTNVLFFASGAFVGLDTVINKNRFKTGIGIGANVDAAPTYTESMSTVLPEDFVSYGLIPEFVARCPITVVFNELDLDAMVKILTEPKNSIVKQYKSLFKQDGIKVDFSDKYLLSVAEACIKQKIGARGLRTVLEKDLQSLQYILPRLSKEGVGSIMIDGEGKANYTYKKVRRKAEK